MWQIYTEDITFSWLQLVQCTLQTIYCSFSISSQCAQDPKPQSSLVGVGAHQRLQRPSAALGSLMFSRFALLLRGPSYGPRKTMLTSLSCLGRKWRARRASSHAMSIAPQLIPQPALASCTGRSASWHGTAAQRRSGAAAQVRSALALESSHFDL